MAELKFDDFNITLDNFYASKDQETIALEFHIPFKTLQDKFTLYYQDHIDVGKYFDCEIDGQNYFGRFGRILFDKKGNVQVFFVKDSADQGANNDSSFVPNVSQSDPAYINSIKSISKYNNVITKLTNILVQHKLLDENEREEIFKELPNDYYPGVTVDDLPRYLKTYHQTLDDLAKIDAL